jgi:hypothetical protein
MDSGVTTHPAVKTEIAIRLIASVGQCRNTIIKNSSHSHGAQLPKIADLCDLQSVSSRLKNSKSLKTYGLTPIADFPDILVVIGVGRRGPVIYNPLSNRNT